MHFDPFHAAGENPPSDEDSSLREEAAAWIIKLDRGLHPEEELAYQKRLQEEPRLRQAIEQSQSAWALLDSIPEDMAEETGFTHQLRHLYRHPWVAGLSALAAVLILTLVLWGSISSGIFQGESLKSQDQATGVPTTRLLADGSIIRINSGAVIEVEFSDNFRNVYLNSGEAHFKVESDPQRPFVVYVDRVQVKAIGTAFNVQSQEDAIDVIVTEGTVQISGRTQESPQAALEDQNLEALRDFIAMQGFVSSGQRALIRLKRNKRQTRMEMDIVGADSTEVEATLAWQRPLLTLGGDTLGNIAENFEEKTGLQLEIADPRLNDLRIGGRFPSEDPKGFLQILKLNYGIDWQEKEDGSLMIGQQRSGASSL